MGARVWTAIGAVALLALAGCSSDKGGGSGPATLTPEEMPLQKFLSEAIGMDLNDMFSKDDMMKAQAASEQAIAECMKAEGFEYVPQPVDESMFSFAEDGGPQWGTREFAEKNGYGFGGFGDEPSESGSEPPVDPNSAIVEAMSESERAAYEKALYGDMLTWGMEGDGTDPGTPPADQGCQGEAQKKSLEGTKVGALQKVFEDPQFASLMQEMNSTGGTDAEGPEVTKAKAAWTSCMADAGYPDLADSDAAQTLAQTKYEKLWQQENPSKADTDAAQAEEIKIAVADFDCRDSSGVVAAQQKTQIEQEQAFLDKNKPELEAFAAAIKEALG